MTMNSRDKPHSFIKDGYEIIVEGTYVINGKKKKKVRKKKLQTYSLTQKSSVQQSKLVSCANSDKDISLQRELNQINQMQEQTNMLPKAQELLTKTDEIR